MTDRPRAHLEPPHLEPPAPLLDRWLGRILAVTSVEELFTEG